MIFRKATKEDIAAIAEIYENIIDEQEKGGPYVGWQKGVYPTAQTAEAALLRDDLFVLQDGQILGAAIINKIQVDVYFGAPWEYSAKEEEVCVLHTLVIEPKAAKKGYGKAFVSFYEEYAKEHNCPYLRMDTNAKNIRARTMYKKLGYKEIAVVPTVFNGISGVDLVLLEKKL